MGGFLTKALAKIAIATPCTVGGTSLAKSGVNWCRHFASCKKLFAEGRKLDYANMSEVVLA